MSKELRNALGHWATGVAVITAVGEDGQHYGMTVNSFASVSLDPALVLWSIQNDCEYSSIFDHGYCVNILSEAQSDVVWKFTQGDQNERFSDVPFTTLTSGRRVLTDAIAHFDCQLHRRVSAGDHDILIGQVSDYGCNQNAPVLFNQGQISRVAS